MSHFPASPEPPETDAAHLASPLHHGEIRRLDDLLHGARPLPSRAATALASSVAARLDLLDPATTADTAGPQPITPGSLGSWFDDEATGS